MVDPRVLPRDYNFGNEPKVSPNNPCWKCGGKDLPQVMTAHSETPNKPFAFMHDDCRKSLDLVRYVAKDISGE